MSTEENARLFQRERTPEVNFFQLRVRKTRLDKIRSCDS